MDSLGGSMTQDEYMELMIQLTFYEMEEAVSGKDHTKEIEAVKKKLDGYDIESAAEE